MRGHHRLYHKHPAVVGQRTLAASEDNGAAIIIPIVDHVLQDVDICPARHLPEEVAGNGCASPGKSIDSYVFLRPFDNGRNIEQDAIQLRVGHQNRSEERALAASYIHYRQQFEQGYVRETANDASVVTLAIAWSKVLPAAAFCARY